MPNFPAIKISRQQRQSQKKFGFTLFVELRRRAHACNTNLQIVVNTPLKCLHTSRYTKKYLPNFSYLKKSQNVTSQPPKHPSHPWHYKSGVPPPPRVLSKTREVGVFVASVALCPVIKNWFFWQYISRVPRSTFEFYSKALNEQYGVSTRKLSIKFASSVFN